MRSLFLQIHTIMLGQLISDDMTMRELFLKPLRIHPPRIPSHNPPITPVPTLLKPLMPFQLVMIVPHQLLKVVPPLPFQKNTQIPAKATFEN